MGIEDNFDESAKHDIGEDYSTEAETAEHRIVDALRSHARQLAGQQERHARLMADNIQDHFSGRLASLEAAVDDLNTKLDAIIALLQHNKN